MRNDLFICLPNKYALTLFFHCFTEFIIFVEQKQLNRKQNTSDMTLKLLALIRTRELTCAFKTTAVQKKKIVKECCERVFA